MRADDDPRQPHPPGAPHGEGGEAFGAQGGGVGEEPTELPTEVPTRELTPEAAEALRRSVRALAGEPPAGGEESEASVDATRLPGDSPAAAAPRAGGAAPVASAAAAGAGPARSGATGPAPARRSHREARPELHARAFALAARLSSDPVTLVAAHPDADVRAEAQAVVRNASSATLGVADVSSTPEARPAGGTRRDPRFHTPRDATPERARELADLLWRELELHEDELGGSPQPDARRRAPERYFQRRREEMHRRSWGRVRPKLAQPWRRLVECSSAEARELCMELGARLAALATLGLDPRELRRWLAPLQGPSAHRVARVLVTHPPSDREKLSESARALYEDCKTRRRGEGILSLMGRRALAALLDSLPSEEREEARRIARTNILDVLEQLEPLQVRTGAERARAWELVRSVIPFEDGTAE